MTYYTTLKTKLVGDVLLLANDTDLTGLYYLDSEGIPKTEGDWVKKPKQPVLAEAAKQLKEYLAGKRKTFSIPCQFDGTEFQERVWTYTARIPYGETRSYSELAQTIGFPKAVRAVGTALANNPIDMIIPAHRVISKSGSMGGFTGKWSRKVNLLELEKR